MLSIGAMGGGQGMYYVSLSREDYYMEGGEPPGQWLGEGAKQLGLIGTVEREDFLSLFAGYGVDGTPLVQNAGKDDRQPGWDLTFSAPKSVSLAWALSDPATRERISEAHFASVSQATSFLQDRTTTRRGKRGTRTEPAHLVIAAFEHGTSRAQDPQLHTHALVLNLAVRNDGTTGTIESKQFYEAKMAAGALYRADLSCRLEELGYSIEREGTTFEIRGVPPSLLKETSKRRAEIEAQLELRGERGARASSFAALSTRQVKDHVARGELLDQWREVGLAHGFGPDDAHALRRSPSLETSKNGVSPLAVQIQEALKAGAQRLVREKSHFSEIDLLRAVAEEGQGRGLSAPLIREAVSREIGTSPDIVYLGEQKSEPRYTTRELLETEKRLLGDVDHLKNDRGRHAVDERTLSRSIRAAEREETKKASAKDPRAGKREMSPEQREALTYITHGSGSIAVVSGMAGTGKTFLLSAGRKAWEKSGFKVVGAAVSGKASRGLKEGSGIENMTLARLLWTPDQLSMDALKHHARQLLRAARGKRTFKREGVQIDSNTVVVVDEAGMVGTHDMARLVEKVKAAGAKLVLVGDARQLQPIDVGGPFRAIEKLLGGAKLTSIIRQELDFKDKDPYWKRDAVVAFAEGRAGAALKAFEERGFLKVANGREEAKQSLVSAWMEKGANKPDENLIFVGTREEAKELNRKVQAARDRARKLGFRSVRINGETIREKDRVLITKTDPALNVDNGDLGTVKRLELVTGRMVLKMDDGREVSLPYRHFKDIELGYAITTHKGQGTTVKNSFVLCSSVMDDREMTYVQASRAKQGTHFFTERVLVWNSQDGRKEDQTLSELSLRMSLSRQKDLAHDVMSQDL